MTRAPLLWSDWNAPVYVPPRRGRSRARAPCVITRPARRVTNGERIGRQGAHERERGQLDGPLTASVAQLRSRSSDRRVHDRSISGIEFRRNARVGTGSRRSSPAMRATANPTTRCLASTPARLPPDAPSGDRCPATLAVTRVDRCAPSDQYPPERRRWHPRCIDCLIEKGVRHE